MADDEPEPSHQLHKKSLSCQFVSAIEILGMVLDTMILEKRRVRWK